MSRPLSQHSTSFRTREGAGDAGICFEYAVHHAIDTKNLLIYDLASEVLENFCSIRSGVESLLFGPAKDGVIPVIETVNDALTDASVVFVGNRGRPPRLKKYIPKRVNAFRRSEERNNLPRSIQGIQKADLFLGNPGPDQWVGTTVKISSTSPRIRETSDRYLSKDASPERRSA